MGSVEAPILSPAIRDHRLELRINPPKPKEQEWQHREMGLMTSSGPRLKERMKPPVVGGWRKGFLRLKFREERVSLRGKEPGGCWVTPTEAQWGSACMTKSAVVRDVQEAHDGIMFVSTDV